MRTVTHFEQAAKMMSVDDTVKNIVCGPDVQDYLENLQKFVDAGYDHIYIHQIGPDQEGFFGFCQRELFPQFQ